MHWEIYRQDVFEEELPPEGKGWEPFSASALVAHNGMRESLGGGIKVEHEVVWWRREAPDEPIDITVRPETGPMCFGEDWPGVFIRGDNAAHFATVLQPVYQEYLDDAPAGEESDVLAMAGVQQLYELLTSSRVLGPDNPEGTQECKEWRDCQER